MSGEKLKLKHKSRKREVYNEVRKFGDIVYKLILSSILMLIVILASPWIFGITLKETFQIARMVIIWLIFSSIFTYIIMKGVKK